MYKGELKFDDKRIKSYFFKMELRDIQIYCVSLQLKYKNSFYLIINIHYYEEDFLSHRSDVAGCNVALRPES